MHRIRKVFLHIHTTDMVFFVMLLKMPTIQTVCKFCSRWPCHSFQPIRLNKRGRKYLKISWTTDKRWANINPFRIHRSRFSDNCIFQLCLGQKIKHKNGWWPLINIIYSSTTNTFNSPCFLSFKDEETANPASRVGVFTTTMTTSYISNKFASSRLQ